MFNKLKNLYSKQLSKIKKFDNEKLKNKLYIDECNNEFSIQLDKKIESSQVRIAAIRKSIKG